MRKSWTRSLRIRTSWIAVLAGLPILTGAALPPNLSPARPVPAQQSSDIIQVDLLGRFLEDAGVRRHKSTTRHRAPRNNETRSKAPQPPVAGNIPVPAAKPEKQAQADAASQTENPTAKQTESQTATPPAATPDTAGTKPPVPATAPTVAPTVAQPATASEPAHEAEVPKPLAKPETASETGTAATDDDKASGKDAAKPEQAGTDDKKPEGKQDEETAEKPASPPPPPIVKEDPQQLKACLADLTAIGAKFEPTDPIDEGDGCGIEHPIDVAEVLPGLSLGGATMRCETALTMAHWLKDTVQPALNIAKPGRKITGIVPGSTYACRLRNNAATGKISEHARGNAFDVAAFKFDNGEKMEMKPRTDDHTLEGAFQKTATAGACLHFTTVLAPGSDAAHETHLHLDIMDRKGGYRICE